MSWILALWERLPRRLRIAIGWIAAGLAAAAAIFLRGRRAGAVIQAAKDRTAAAESNAKAVDASMDAASARLKAAPDGAAVQKELDDLIDGAAK